MKFGIFDYIDARGETLQKTYEDRLGLLQAAEAAGFYGYHLTEHHATPFVDDAVAERISGRRRARNAAHPPRHAALSLAALPSAAAVGRALHARSSQRRPPRHRRGARHLAHGVRRLRRRFRASGRRLRARLERALPRLHAGAHRLPLRSLHLQGRPGCDPAAAAPASAVVVRAARRSWSGVCGAPRHARRDARPRREGAHWRTYAADRKRQQSPVETPHCGVMRAIFVADSDAEAERIARPAYKRWFDSLAWLWVERGSFPPISISADYDQSKAAGTLVVGSPDTVGRVLTTQAERIRQNYLVLMLAFGLLTHAQEMRSLALFKSEIMPRLAAMNYDEEASAAPALATA